MSATQDVDPFSQPFEIGLVMAGAISAGAYTAGVMDFLLQALDAWYGARAAGEDVPPHEVRIKVMTGASAGGMTAAISVGALATRFPPVTDPAAADSAVNKLFDSWVNRIDIAALLGAQDLADPKAPVRSVLDSTILRTIADQSPTRRSALRRRPSAAPISTTCCTSSRPFRTCAACPTASRWKARSRVARISSCTPTTSISR